MIYVTLGTQKFQFDRILIKLDELIENNKINDEVIVQCIYHTYKPKNFEIFALKPIEEVEELVKKSQLVITHAGTGSLVQCIKFKKNTVVVPRLSEFGEHVDNHQIEIAGVFKAKGNATIVTEIDDLDMYVNNYSKANIIDIELDNTRLLKSIGEYIDEL
ncbi:PssE/Cps14G family polysaccharide biosynthesis glycosyltransferase [Terrisporobacter mayombei]|uniref:PssE/Cps14G family polysaccharide biosynthesis glycosyltransferase n=1 Tax=Terrisporobacter mayombei TaxID=1541 RepID=UPI00265B2412|nr:PssE/Cps14G family polysaccharide biosynthesis glycosyltransferase [Terrisporobacter mayombei]MCC3671234.1 beta(1,3)galactosyltransferase EpsH [Terrisporobacter mayombei]